MRDFVFPMLRASAIYEDTYLLGTSIARPLIAKRQIEIARREGADAVAHGATGKGNDQVRFELTYYALEPGIRIIAPWRIWDLDSRTKLIAYAEEKGIPVPVTREKPYSTDRNLLHISYEGGVLEDPWREPYEDMFLLTVSPEQAPDKAGVRRDRLRGRQPGRVDGERSSPAALLARLNDDRRPQRHRPRRPGREPLRRHEVARRLRDARRHDPARRAPRRWSRSPSTARSCTCATR